MRFGGKQTPISLAIREATRSSLFGSPPISATQGINIWVDQLDIRPSEHWDRAIERAVSSCRGIVVVLSPRSVASDNVADEISFAIDGGKSVLPVMIERCNLPLRITRMQVIDATANYSKALEQCVAELRRRKEPLPEPTRPQKQQRSRQRRLSRSRES